MSGTFSGEIIWMARMPLRPSATSAYIEAFTEPIWTSRVSESAPSAVYFPDEFRFRGIFYVNGGETFRAVGDVEIGAGDVEALGISE